MSRRFRVYLSLALALPLAVSGTAAIGAAASAAGAAPTPATRLQAIGLVGILRSLTSPELRAAISGLPPADSLAYVSAWLLAAAQAIGNGAPQAPVPGLAGYGG